MTTEQEFAIEHYHNRSDDTVWLETEHESPDPDNSFFTLITVESPHPSDFDEPRWCCRVEHGSNGVRYTMDIWPTDVYNAAKKLAFKSLEGVGREQFGELVDDVRGAVGLKLFKYLTDEEFELLPPKSI